VNVIAKMSGQEICRFPLIYTHIDYNERFSIRQKNKSIEIGKTVNEEDCGSEEKPKHFPANPITAAINLEHTQHLRYKKYIDKATRRKIKKRVYKEIYIKTIYI